MDEVFHSGVSPIKSKESLLDRLTFILNIRSESKIRKFKANQLNFLEAALVLHVVLDIFSYRIRILRLKDFVIVIRIISAIFFSIVTILVWDILLVLLLLCILLGSLLQELFFHDLLLKHVLELVDSRFARWFFWVDLRQRIFEFWCLVNFLLGRKFHLFLNYWLVQKVLNLSVKNLSFFFLYLRRLRNFIFGITFLNLFSLWSFWLWSLLILGLCTWLFHRKDIIQVVQSIRRKQIFFKNRIIFPTSFWLFALLNRLFNNLFEFFRVRSSSSIGYHFHLKSGVRLLLVIGIWRISIRRIDVPFLNSIKLFLSDWRTNFWQLRVKFFKGSFYFNPVKFI